MCCFFIHVGIFIGHLCVKSGLLTVQVAYVRKRTAAGNPQDEAQRQRRRTQDNDRRTARQARGSVAARMCPVDFSPVPVLLLPLTRSIWLISTGTVRGVCILQLIGAERRGPHPERPEPQPKRRDPESERRENDGREHDPEQTGA